MGLARPVQRGRYTLSTSLTSSAHGFLLVACLALSASVGAAQTAPSSADAKAAAVAAKDKVRKTITSAADVKKALEEASKQRDQFIADYESLAKQLKAATEEQKQAIREKMEAQKKAFEEVTNALHKQIRDDQRKQRAAAAKR